MYSSIRLRSASNSATSSHLPWQFTLSAAILPVCGASRPPSVHAKEIFARSRKGYGTATWPVFLVPRKRSAAKHRVGLLPCYCRSTVLIILAVAWVFRNGEAVQADAGQGSGAPANTNPPPSGFPLHQSNAAAATTTGTTTTGTAAADTFSDALQLHVRHLCLCDAPKPANR